MSIASTLFGHRLPAVPNDGARRAELLADQKARMQTIVSVMPAVGRIASGIECDDTLDRYAEGIQAAYGKG